MHPVIRNGLSKLAPPPKETASEWADKFRWLSPSSSARPGRWRTDLSPYQRGIMDAVTDPNVEIITFMKSSQVGATEIINNVLGYFIHRQPGPILVIQPNIHMGQVWSIDRLKPMLDETPVLKELVSGRRDSKGSNNVLHKTFVGGQLSIVGANSPAGLASRPVMVILADELDRWERSAGEEGDPLRLAIKRTTTFFNRKILVVSTPTIHGQSRIEEEFLLSDQRYFFVKCPHCGHRQRLVWDQMHYTPSNTADAAYTCGSIERNEGCGTLWREREKKAILQTGEWEATAKGEPKRVGFHISELYSTWSPWSKMAQDFVEAGDDPQQLQVFYNTSLGQTYVREEVTVDAHDLEQRAEDYTDLPEQVKFLTCGVDVQKNRIEALVMGWGDNKESWVIEHEILGGSPTKDEVWDKLDAYLRKKFDVEGDEKRKLPIRATCIDAGNWSSQVHSFCSNKHSRGIYAVRGQAGEKHPIVKRPTEAKGKIEGRSKRVRLYNVGTWNAKDVLYDRLAIDTPGPGYIHFHDRLEPEFFAQMTSEARRIQFRKGKMRNEYIQLRQRNEALDMAVYNLAAYELLKKRIIRPKKEAEPSDTPSQSRTELDRIVARARRRRNR